MRAIYIYLNDLNYTISHIFSSPMPTEDIYCDRTISLKTDVKAQTSYHPLTKFPFPPLSQFCAYSFLSALTWMKLAQWLPYCSTLVLLSPHWKKILSKIAEQFSRTCPWPDRRFWLSATRKKETLCTNSSNSSSLSPDDSLFFPNPLQ